MELHLPEVVFGELHFQQTTSALKALSNIADNFTELAKLSKDVADDTPLLAALASRFEAGTY